ncbi:MAG TPA: glycosyltransferase family 4 protein [Polyangia bacterium]|nr:glycosyltransferase family 4 protein [Polyangia bacterium]
MHVLLYSRPFFPATGGIETVSLTLAQQITAAGHRCTVVTETPADPANPGAFAFAPKFEIVRRPSQLARLALVRAADVVHSNGASLALFAHAKLARRPFVWTHAGYQLVSVDGLGWVDGAPAPLHPLASLALHARRSGPRYAAAQALKLGLRNVVGRLVDKNVAITHWVADRQPLPRQVVIYNPFPLGRFTAAKQRPAPTHDFVYLGRLVSEKGVPTLIEALARVNARPGKRPATLLLVGDGPERGALEELVRARGLGAHVTFAGMKRDDALVDAVADGAVAVVPSAWEEPMGGVAVELLAAGKPLIVSERGGLAECVGEAAWTFPNGDAPALAERMAAVFDDETLRTSKARFAPDVLARFDEARLTREYLKLYQDLVRA